MSPRPRARTHRLRRGLLLAAAATLALSGCMKLDMDLELQSDDTVDGSMTIGMSSALAELAGEDPAAMSAQMREEIMADDSIGDVRVEDYDDGEYVGTTMHFTGAGLSDFGGGDEDALRIERVDDEFVVTGRMDLSEGGGALPGMAQPDVRIAITFPGAVTEHTGELEGTTVTWVPVAGEVTEISARGGATEGGLGVRAGALLWVAAGAGVLVLALVVVVVLLVVRRRRPAAAVAPASLPVAAPAAVPGAPAPQGWVPSQPHAPGAQPPAQGWTQQAPPAQPPAQSWSQQTPPAQPPAQDWTQQAPPAQPPAPPTQPPAPPTQP